MRYIFLSLFIVSVLTALGAWLYDLIYFFDWTNLAIGLCFLILSTGAASIVCFDIYNDKQSRKHSNNTKEKHK